VPGGNLWHGCCAHRAAVLSQHRYVYLPLSQRPVFPASSLWSMARTLRGRGFRQLSFGATSCPGYCERSYKLRVLRGYVSARRSRQHLRMAKSTQASAFGEQLKLCPVSVSKPGGTFDNKPPRWLGPRPSAARVRRIRTRVARRIRLSNAVWPRYGSAPHQCAASVERRRCSKERNPITQGSTP
jgi:hypothetical protein